MPRRTAALSVPPLLLCPVLALALVSCSAGAEPSTVAAAPQQSPSPSAEAYPPQAEAQSPDRPAGAPPGCPPGQDGALPVIPGYVDAAMGLRAMTLWLSNCTDAPRTVSGPPPLSVLDTDGDALDEIDVTRDLTAITTGVDEGPPTPVTLAPGEAARATVLWRNTYDDVSRPPVKGAALSVAPVTGAAPQRVAVDGGVDLGSTGRLAVGPWRTVPGPGVTPGTSATPGTAE